MWLAIAAVCLGVSAARAQTFMTQLQMPDGIVGRPYDLSELLDPGSEPEDDDTLVVQITGTVPPGMTFSLSPFIYRGTPTAAGTFVFNLRITFTDIAGFEFIVAITHVIRPATTAVAHVPGTLAFALTEGGAAAVQSVVITNQTSQGRTFTAAATVNSGGAWLSATPAMGALGAFSPVSLSVAANPAGLTAGVYSGLVTVMISTGERLAVPVLLTVTSTRQSLVLSQTGLTFLAVAGGGAPPTQSFQVFNGGAGALNWTASASTLSGGSWLSINPAGGSSDANNAPRVDARASPTGLAPGDYYGQIQVTAAAAANSPQSVSVVLNVLPPAQDPGPVVQPAGLIFVGTAGGANPSSQAITATVLSSLAATFTATTAFGSGPVWAAVSPAAGMAGPGQPAQIQVQANLAGLNPGIYRGELKIRFDQIVTRRVDLLLVVVPRPATAASSVRAADGCAPTRLVAVFTLLGAAFRVTAGWPVPIEVRVVDDCGTAMTTGSVVSSFSNDDPPVALASLRDGRWSGTWLARNPAPGVTVSIRAQQTQPRIEGSLQVGGGLQPNPVVPVVNSGGAVSAASFAGFAPLAPGSLVAIFGSGMAETISSSDRLPLATELAGTRVVLGGRQVPLVFASSGQINAMVPYDLPANSMQQLIVRKGNRISTPEPVTIAAAQPAIFTKNLSGSGAGIIVGVKADGSRAFLIEPGDPVSAGDVLVIYGEGLGATNPAVPAGTAVPSAPLHNTVNQVSVMIGGRPADVLFAGLAATFTGLYQVNAVVPAGVAGGNDVPVTLMVAGQTSRPVTIAVR